MLIAVIVEGLAAAWKGPVIWRNGVEKQGPGHISLGKSLLCGTQLFHF